MASPLYWILVASTMKYISIYLLDSSSYISLRLYWIPVVAVTSLLYWIPAAIRFYIKKNPPKLFHPLTAENSIYSCETKGIYPSTGARPVAATFRWRLVEVGPAKRRANALTFGREGGGGG